MWINRLFIDLADCDERNCLTIDCSGINITGPRRYRTRGDNSEKQVFYFNESRKDKVYNVFKSERTKSGNLEKGLYFKIDRVRVTAKHSVQNRN